MLKPSVMLVVQEGRDTLVGGGPTGAGTPGQYTRRESAHGATVVCVSVRSSRVKSAGGLLLLLSLRWSHCHAANEAVFRRGLVVLVVVVVKEGVPVDRMTL